jgi:hypothetical protein
MTNRVVGAGRHLTVGSSSVDEFADTVARVRNRILNQSTIDVSSQALAYMTSDARLSEAEIVSPCIARFVFGEIWPPEQGKPIGRYS